MVTLMSALLVSCVATAAVRLDSFTVDRSEVSVSGMSSGAAMAVQFQVAHSAAIKGVGSFAGEPYWCSEGDLGKALVTCMGSPSSVSVGHLVKHAQSEASHSKIDPLSNMNNTKAFVWAGKDDNVVNPVASQKIEEFYRSLSNQANVKAVYLDGTQHGFPTENYGNNCSDLGSPYISNCNYSGAYEMLNFIHGNLLRPTTSTVLKGQLIEFYQSEFVPAATKGKRFIFGSMYTYLCKMMGKAMSSMLVNGFSASASVFGSFFKQFAMAEASLMGAMTRGKPSLDSIGYAYIPSGCYDSTIVCKLHVAFHGCKMQREVLHDTFARHAGYNEVGELNNIIILYPQTKAEDIANPNGCWDWWAYTSTDYNNKAGVQIRTVKNMIDRVTGARP